MYAWRDDGTVAVLAGTGAFGTFRDGAPATLSALSAPSGVAFGDDGDLFVSMSVFSTIARVDRSSGTISAFVAPGYPIGGAPIQEANGVAFDLDGHLIVAGRSLGEGSFHDAAFDPPANTAAAVIAGSGTFGCVLEGGGEPRTVA